jgi:hypothetical protein
MGGLALPGICPVPGARAFLRHAVSATSRVLGGTIMTANEGLVSAAALNQPKFSISVTQILTTGTGPDDPSRDRGLPRDPCIAVGPPIEPREVTAWAGAAKPPTPRIPHPHCFSACDGCPARIL